MLPNMDNIRLCMIASFGKAPDKRYIAGSATVIGTDNICLRSLLYCFSKVFIAFSVGMIHFRPYRSTRVKWKFQGQVRFPGASLYQLDCR